MDAQAWSGLLWLSETAKESHKYEGRLSDSGITDLGVDRIVREISSNHKYFDDIRKIVLYLCSDVETIRYRLDIMEDFYRLPGMGAEFEKLLPTLSKLGEYNHSKYTKDAEPLRKIAWQVDILNLYIQSVDGLNAILRRCEPQLKSDGLRTLLQLTDRLKSEESYQALTKELPDFKEKLQNMTSVTIRLELNHELQPAEATILSFETKSNKKKSLISRLLAKKTEEEPYQGQSPYQDVLKRNNPVMDGTLLRSLGEVFGDALLPIGNMLKRYIDTNTRMIASLELELGFYIGGAKFIRQIESAGFRMCKPVVAPPEERVCRIDAMFDIVLTSGLAKQYPDMNLSNSIVTNDVEFGPEGRVLILTGPNQGGKTTYTRAIGVAQMLFQTGLFVPGSEAVMSPADRIFTHFSEEEKPNVDNGRLGEESKRIRDIFENASPTSLILLNESFSSTSHADSLYLARDVVKGIKLLGSRAVYATHILELAAGADQMNAEYPGDSRLLSIVAGMDRETGKRTYKVLPGPPNDQSFAKDIAHKYGVTFEQIAQMLRDRKVLPREASMK